MSAPNLKTVQGVLLTQANTSDRHHEVHLVLQTHAVENETEGCGDNGDGHCWQSELGFTNASIPDCEVVCYGFSDRASSRHLNIFSMPIG